MGWVHWVILYTHWGLSFPLPKSTLPLLSKLPCILYGNPIQWSANYSLSLVIFKFLFPHFLAIIKHLFVKQGYFLYSSYYYSFLWFKFLVLKSLSSFFPEVTSRLSLTYLIYFSVCFCFLGPYLWPVEVPRFGVELEL